MSEPEFVFVPHATALHSEGGDIFEDALTPACDFCLDSRLRWEYPCEDFFIDSIFFGSAGGWLACERCSEMIEAGHFANLAVRSVRSWTARFGSISQDQIDSMGMIQDGFFAHRNGPRFPLTTGRTHDEAQGSVR